MPRVQLPPGCYGLSGHGFKTERVRPGTAVNVSDDIARRIAKGSNGKLGIIRSDMPTTIGTKNGKWCHPCHFLAQSWSTECPRCGGPTEDER